MFMCMIGMASKYESKCDAKLRAYTDSIGNENQKLLFFFLFNE